ncbi:MAG: pteridine reductase [Gammaproteobacteria bacterium]|nr:pteridine reductase [Gammaproteobacteria bacterium]
MDELHNQVILITGAAKRIGASTARLLHAKGANLILHYNSSESDALRLMEELCANRAHSVRLIKGDLSEINAIKISIRQALAELGRLDALINNASSFFPTPLASTTEDQWQRIFDTNLKAPFFLAQATAPYLKKQNGSIINIVDIYAQRPLLDHPVYSASKAGLASLTQSLALELGPQIRVNGVSPGAILWPEINPDEVSQQRMISRTPLKRVGDPQDIAKTILFLLSRASFITGQVINVDGGRTVVP